MVVALFALAAAMILGGLTAVAQGYDIVLLERGWTLVISGSVCATGGALLLGLAAIVSRLNRIRAELVKAAERMAQPELDLPAGPPLNPLGAVSAGLLAGGATDSGTPAGAPDESQPTLPLFMRRDHDEDTAPAASRDQSAADEEPDPEDEPAPPGRDDARKPRLTLPRYLFGGRDADRRSGADDTSSELARPGEGPERPAFVIDDLDDDEDDRGEAASQASQGPIFPPVGPGADDAARPGPAAPPATLEASREAEPEPEVDRTPDAASEGPRTVVGTYNSGDNRYVMFSDGSIEAETPDGVFRFGSLDELKEFIASGGEGRSAKL